MILVKEGYLQDFKISIFKLTSLQRLYTSTYLPKYFGSKKILGLFPLSAQVQLTLILNVGLLSSSEPGMVPFLGCCVVIRNELVTLALCFILSRTCSSLMCCFFLEEKHKIGMVTLYFPTLRELRTVFSLSFILFF